MNTSAPVAATYHHGDLPSTLVRAAVELVREEPGVSLSLRAVARRAGVSPAAPYRHFADRQALLSAVAAVGYRELTQVLQTEHEQLHSVDDLADVGAAYVRFALTESGLFRVMFTEGCDPQDPGRADAVASIHAYLRAASASVLVTPTPDVVAMSLWACVHGLAFLHLDGKLDSSDLVEVDGRVRSAIRALVSVTAR